ncbi:Mobile element protein [Bathymodiolus thermophilus thioautotrophic gill symbiont]|nr:Mobile element protein [Bathymodiolus thermophilus thioautotrophic gill symbiont]
MGRSKSTISRELSRNTGKKKVIATSKPIDSLVKDTKRIQTY